MSSTKQISHSGQIYRQRLIPVALDEVGDAIRRPEDASRGDHHVDSSEPLNPDVHGSPQRGRVGDISH